MITSSTVTENPRSITENSPIWSMLVHVCLFPSTTAAAVWLMGWSSATQTGWSNAKLISGYPGSFKYVCRKKNKSNKNEKKTNCTLTMYCCTENISETDHLSYIYTKTVRRVRGDDGDDFIFIATMGIDIVIISFAPDGACRLATICIAMMGSDLTQWWNGWYFGNLLYKCVRECKAYCG